MQILWPGDLRADTAKRTSAKAPRLPSAVGTCDVCIAWYCHRLLARLLTFVIALVLVVTVAPGSARAESRRVAFVNVDDAVREASTAILSPWNIDVVRLRLVLPSGSDSQVAKAAAANTRSYGLAALVWIAPRDGLNHLWLFDTDSGDLVSIALEVKPPYDEPTAAALALSVKALLRHSRVAPTRERYHVLAKAAQRTSLAVDVEGGLSTPRQDTGGVEGRMGARLTWMPRLFGKHAGLFLGIRSGPGTEVQEATLTASLDETTLCLGGHGSLQLGRIALALELGPSVRLHKLAGQNLDTDAQVTKRNLNPSVDGAVSAGVEIGQGITVGIRAGGGLLLRRQRFLVGEAVAVELPRGDFHAAVFLRLPLLRN